MSQAIIDALTNVNSPTPKNIPVIIPSGGSLSPAVSFSVTIGKIVFPAAWDAAVLTFQTSDDGGTTWNDVYDTTGAVMTLQAAAGRACLLDLGLWIVVRTLKVRSGTPASPVNQTAARTLTLVGI